MKSLCNNQLETAVIDWPVYMKRALELACNVITATPNPRVGCVIVKEKTIVGEGWHVAAGQPHAEAMALQVADDRASDATAFVSLEPCAHRGRTGPCVEALIAAEIKNVVVAAVDPNPSVSGKGVDLLESAGIQVFHLVDFEDAARAINRGYFKRREAGIPFVRCKLAMSLDGRTALANGESKWITGSAARSDVQKLRASSSAIITGIETVLLDDPSMNVRIDELELSDEALENNRLSLAQQPLRVILDSKLRTPGSAKILAGNGFVKIYTTAEFETEKSLARNVEILKAKDSPQRVNLRSVLESLASDFACNEVLVEAGSTLSGAFIESGLVDELIIYIAPRLLGNDAKGLLNISGLQSISESIRFEIKDLCKLGTDIRVTLIPIDSEDG
ncbi:MAG: bifunctional diaminohydroxyphosphoribosylaminopyrimidine deaminase/5-amino-6-(5-phosphoribosylamino)uracil reductase RibD [Proteobacteria bacterium]|nr:bifunctional diaminohydroxyphosphoribosylaminopyrimidine deaminase/5-amino-6-(5-phosphoribosylamino)uracil reductase RibD [Pseudomonadota bacterium]